MKRIDFVLTVTPLLFIVIITAGAVLSNTRSSTQPIISSTTVSSSPIRFSPDPIESATSSPTAIAVPTGTYVTIRVHQIPSYTPIASTYQYSPHDIIQAINAERVVNGLPILSDDVELHADAGLHANAIYLTGDFSHTTGGINLHDRITLPVWHYSGENLGAAFESLDDLLGAWMASPLHRANILNPHFTQVGVATAGVYVVAIFTD